MIRRATAEDVPQLLDLAREEHAASRLAGTPFDVRHAATNFAQVVNGLASAVFVSENEGALHGLFAGLVQMNLHNRYTTAYELMWFATDGSGMKLLAAFKDWAGRMRATSLVVHGFSGMVDEARMTRAMGRKGLMPMGMTYQMKLEN